MPHEPLKVLDLFSGIGGFSLGLERAGMRTVAFCEIEPYCRAVLRKHWPEVPIYEDVRNLTAAQLAADGISVDVICGGFPCQDVSAVGARRGIDAEASGLWRELFRLVCEIRPRFAIVENTVGLFDRGFDRVLGDLAEIGFDAEWSVFSACAFGAPHARERVFLLAYAHEQRQETRWRAGNDNGSAMAGRGEYSEYIHQASIFARRAGRKAFADEPQLGRVAHGIPHRVDRNAAIGNAIFPAIPELIGRAILAAEGMT